RNRSHWSTSKTPSYTKSVSWQHHQLMDSIDEIIGSSPAIAFSFQQSLISQLCFSSLNLWRTLADLDNKKFHERLLYSQIKFFK
ncbi:hypothetical protein, partial [Klebsiella pneumoniae]|uniref:hypothetical protein n=1 Tax=Klebsiella pneumoniae TaxID=573 RepID=UPI001BAA340A